MILSAVEISDYKNAVLQIADGDPFACRIISLYNSYNPSLAFVDYWLTADERGTANGAIARNGSNFILFLTDKTDLEEVSSFMRVAGATGVLCGGDYTLDLFGASNISGVVMKKEMPFEEEEVQAVQPDIRAAYELIVRCADESFTPPPFEDFYVDVNHKLRHGAMRLYGISDGDTLAAVAMTVAESESGAVLGAVACDPAYRRHGFGSAIVKHITNRLVAENKTVFLHRAQNANAAFYSNLGFEECGTWREYSMKH